MHFFTKSLLQFSKASFVCLLSFSAVLDVTFGNKYLFKPYKLSTGIDEFDFPVTEAGYVKIGLKSFRKSFIFFSNSLISALASGVCLTFVCIEFPAQLDFSFQKKDATLWALI